MSMLSPFDIDAVKQIAKHAGDAIMTVYHSSDLGIETKKDESPVTEADLKAHHIIEQGLLEMSPWPILSEESTGIDYDTRKEWETFWLVDPLDGTKEFIAKNDEFTVNIALIHQGQPVFGLVSAPALDVVYWSDEHGAYMQKGKLAKEQIKVRPLNPDNLTIVASRRHGGHILDTFQSLFNKVECIAKGSSLKFCEVAAGKADAYPRVAPTSEWDTAAAQAILEKAGGAVLNWNSKEPLCYNKEELLNPYFIALSKKEEWEPFLAPILAI